MKNFIAYVEAESTETVRLLELIALPQDSPRASSLAGISQEVACIECVTRMSRVHEGTRFVWGHEEKDGRTWLHGIAVGGEYRAIGGSNLRKRRTRELITTFADRETVRAVSDSDPFEIDLDNPPFDRWTSMTFKLDGIEVGSVYKEDKQ